ncbi:MAG: hypothetical protein V4621_08325 [Pseudomonadota bacterium]
MLTKEEKVKIVQEGKKYGDLTTVATAHGLAQDTVLKIAKGARNNEAVLNDLVALVQKRSTEQPAQ